MKYLPKAILSFLFFSVTQLFAQTYGNEWIDYSQEYYRIPVAEKGIYKITKQMLDQAGFPTTTVNPKNIQLFYHGQEQPIYIYGEDDFILDNGDYILFYGEPNDGWLDSAMYDNPAEQTNPYYSLINDTAAYFLTWKTDASVKKRFSVESDTVFSQFTATTYCTKEQINNYTGSYYFGSDLANYASGEGWFDNQPFSNATRTKTITLDGLYNSGTAVFEICVAGAPNSNVTSGVWHELLIDIDGTNYADTTFTGYEFIRKTIDIPVSQLSPSVNVDLTSAFVGAEADRQTTAYIKVLYPHDFDVQGQSVFSFLVDNASGQTKNKLGFTNFSGNGHDWLFDLTNAVMVPVDSDTVLLPNGAEPHQCFLVSGDAVKTVTEITKESFSDFSVIGKNSDYIIITNKSLWTGASDYATYRQTTGYTPLVVDVGELFNQFAYGIRQHPLSIRNFINYIIHQYDSVPKALFLLGKSIHPYMIRQNASTYAQCLVPTYGDPSSDNLFVAGLNGTTYDLAIPVGRLSATTNQEVYDYLQKVMTYEGNAPAEWMKQVLHFGGGSDATQQAQFAGYLSTYEQTIEDTLFGGFVHTFLKNSSQPMQITQSDSISNLINNGISLMTFFGHGSTSGFDQNIDYPSAFYNVGKYPLIMAASCLAGDIHLPAPQRLSEEWVLIQSRGSIGFFAPSSLEIPYSLNIVLSELYRQIGYKDYHQTIGKQIQVTYHNITDINNLYLQKAIWDYTLHGDPALVINSFTKPDLTITAADISTIPDYVSSLTDSFDVQLIITNIGRATTDTFMVELNRVFPNNNTEITQKAVAGCFYKDTILIRLPVATVNGTGINSLCVTVDVMNQVDEMNESNNSACIDFYVHSTDIYPVYPYEYAIYPYDTVTVKASSGDPFMQTENIVFQLDTNDSYNSPFLKETTVTSPGGVIRWQLPFTMTDSTVYYWRVGRVGTNHYNESSFIYIPNKTGWSQAHFFQFKNDDYQYINYDRSNRKFDFISTPKQLHAHNIGSAWGADFLNVKYDIDGAGDNSCCGAGDAMIIAVIDSLTLELWTSDMQDFGQRDYPKCFSRTRPDYYFIFSTDSQSLENMAAFINGVPDGNFILAYSWRDAHFQSWPENAYLSFESLGASNIRFIQNNMPYIFFVQKGNTASADWEVGTSSTDIIDLYESLPTNFYFGNVNSVKIGPSIHWDSFHWREQSIEQPTHDSVYVEIKGMDLSGNETVLMSHISIDSLDIYNLSDSINASQYPYLKLRFFSYDDSTRSAAQLKRWQLTYGEVPETAINPQKGFYLSADTVSEGGIIRFGVATENVSPYDMDSLLVSYWLIDANNSVHLLETKRLGPHPSGSVLMDTVEVNTLNFTGVNRLRVEYNPVNSTTGTYDQLEQYHFNNIAEISFTVERDITNPILDVTFDERHILDGEIVSAKPVISIKLKDENKYLLLNDTSVFAVYLTALEDTTEHRIYFRDSVGNEIMKFTPADSPENDCEISYQPYLPDGLYALRVQAKDISDNESGDNDYYITFRVVSDPSITNVYTYPNPFSLGTHFVFNLTGVDVPEWFYIQIFNAQGKLVKTINLNEVENVHIGPNYTDYTWNGTNDQGGKVAPGLYIYQITVKLKGENLPHAEHPMDMYLQRAYGKMIYTGN